METREAYTAMSGGVTAPPCGAGGNRTVAHNALVRLIVDYLTVQGAWVLKVAGGAYQRPGVPDILACLGGGRLVAVEVKTGSAVLSTAQQRERVALERAGAVFVEARSLEDLIEALTTHRFALRGVLQ